ncbi:MAG: hypothetical protein ABI222_05175 [Opitutaceae bacterium]
MKTVSFFLFALLGSCALFTGCNSVPKMSDIGVTLVGFHPVESPTDSPRAIMTLRFHSENMNPAGFTKSTHEVYFGKLLLGNAENATPVGLPSMGSVNVDVVLNISDPALVRRILAVSDKTKYRLKSTLFYTVDDNKLSYKTSEEGEVEIQGLETAASASIK